MPIAREQLDEWARLANEATPGPWMTFVIPGSPSVGPDIGTLSPAVHMAVTRDKGYGLKPVDAAFIASARAAVPALIAALAEAEAERDALTSALGKAREALDYLRRQSPVGNVRCNTASAALAAINEAVVMK